MFDKSKFATVVSELINCMTSEIVIGLGIIIRV